MLHKFHSLRVVVYYVCVNVCVCIYINTLASTYTTLDFKMRVRYQRKEVGRHVTDDLLDKKTPFTCRNKSIKYFTISHFIYIYL